MEYRLNKNYIEIAESQGVIQNLSVNPIEFTISADPPDTDVRGLYINSNAMLNFKAPDGKRAYVRCYPNNDYARIVVEDCINFKQPASSSGGAGCTIDDAVVGTDRTWSSKKIKSVQDDEHLANKNYVDNAVAALSDAKIADWQPKTVYKKDDIIVYNNTLYRATQPHTSADTFTADMIPGYDKWQSLGGGSGSGTAGYTQVTKLGIIAPKQIDIPIQSTNTFCLPAIEVLKFTPGAQDQVVTACDFNNGDAGDFVASDRVIFGGTMRLKTQYEITMGDPVALEDGFVSESDWIDFADYKAVEDVG